MLKFTRTAFQKARSFIFTQGRQLDQRLFEYHWEAGSRDAVLSALAHYQNSDGGFGHGLEPDLRTPASSVIATSQAFYILRELETPAAHPMVQAAIQYLLNTYDDERGVWPIIPPEAANAPHAWWWTFEDVEKNFGGFLANPRAAVVGHLWPYAPLVPAGFLAQVTDAVLQHLATLPDEMDMYDLYCYIGLSEAQGLLEAQRDRVVEKLLCVIPNSVVLDPDQWGTETSLKPLSVAPFPNSTFVEVISPADLQANLDFEIEHQQADGTWALGWSWEAVDPQAWREAEREWKGHVALNKLRSFQAYGRIEATP